MATIKSFTSLEQSKELAEFLPIESADMHYLTYSTYEEYCDEIVYTANLGKPGMYDKCCIPCWSLAALLDVLPFPNLSKDNLGGDKVGWMVSVLPDNCRYDSFWKDNQLDACYEMIMKLHELKLL